MRIIGLRPLRVLCLGLLSATASAGAIHDTELFNDNTLLPSNDNYSGSIPTFEIDFFGTQTTTLSINSNGAVTIGNLWPIDFNRLPQVTPILAPFFANVDNRYGGTIQWGFDVIDGHQALGAQWLDVMAYNNHPELTNSFQVILIDRADIEAGAFDIEFNYDRITWDSTDPARWDGDGMADVAHAGWINEATGVAFELAGSGTAGALLDSNLDTGLVHNSFNSNVDGRYLFQVRGGVLDQGPTPSLPAPSSLLLLTGGVAWLGLTRTSRRKKG